MLSVYEWRSKMTAEGSDHLAAQCGGKLLIKFNC